MSTQTSLHPAPLDRPGRILAGIVAAPLLPWACVGALIALKPGLVGGTEPAWMLAVFELISAFTAAVLALLALGRFKQGPAITAAFAALAIAVGAVLGAISANNAIGDHPLKPHVIARVAAALLVAAAAIMLSIRSVSAMLRLIVGAAFVFPVVALLGLFLLGKLGKVLGAFDGLHPAVSLVAAILAGVAALAAVSAGGHLVIAAFEPPTADPKPAAPKAE